MASHEPLLYGSTDAGGGYQSAAAGGEEAMASPSAPASSSSPPAVHPQAQAQPYESIAMGHESRPVAAGKHRDGAVAAGGASDGFVSAASVPLDAHLFSCEVLNGQGGPHAKSWLWISRDQICVGVAQYPVLSIWARIKHFLWLLLCCGCCQVPSKAGWRDGQPWRDDDEEDEEAEGEKIEEAHSNLNAGPGVGLPPRLRREASLLVFSSRVDYLSVSSFKAVKERLRYSLPTVWTQWFSPLEFGQWVWHLVKSVANFVFGMEIGWVLVSIGLCIGCICHGAHAAGLYGNPDSFKHGVYWMTALWFFTIGALVYHFEWRIVWTNEAPATRAGRKQLGRWTLVTLLWVLCFLFFTMALIAGLVFLRKQYQLYPNEGPVDDWSKHQNLMCTKVWDDNLGIIRPFEPIPMPAPPAPTPTGPPPEPLQILSWTSGSSSFPTDNFVDVMFVTPVAYDPVNIPITGFNGTAYGSDGSIVRTVQTLPPGGAVSGLPVVGLQFQGLSLSVNYSFSVGASNSQGNSVPAFANEGRPFYPQAQCAAPVTSCVVPPAPLIASLRAGYPGDGYAYVSVVSAPTPGVVIPPVLYYTISGPGGFVSVTAAPGQEIPVPGLVAHQWLSFTATATNVVGQSNTASVPAYVWLENAPTGIENMCSKQQRATLITFLFSAACALVLLVVLLYLTYIRRARRRFAIVTLHGQRQWGLPARVLLELADARALEACFNQTIGKGQYDLASAGYNSQQRLQNKRD